MTLEQSEEVEKEEDREQLEQDMSGIDPQEIDYIAEGWKQASKEEALEIFKNKEDTEEIIVPIDFKKKRFITLYVRTLPITEQLKLMENCMVFDKKGHARFEWLKYYANTYVLMVKKTVPYMPWKEARFYGSAFLSILMKYLPNPMEDFVDEDVTGLPELDQKN